MGDMGQANLDCESFPQRGLNKAALSSVSLGATDFTAYRSEEEKEGQRRGGKEEGPVGSCSGGQGSSCGTPTFRTINFP